MEMKIGKQIRQGDILLKKTNIDLKDFKKTGTRNRTLALGETTGHHHDLQGDVDFYENGNMLICNVNTTATLTHQEHKHLTVQTGKYQFIRQREYDIVNDVQNQVQD